MLTAAIQDIRQTQALPNAQLLGQFQDRARGWAAREDVIRDGTEAEHVKARAVLGLGLRGLRRQVDQAWVFHILLEVHGAADRAARRVNRVAALRALARAGLPVHDARPWRCAGNVLNQHALRTECTVVQPLLVGVLQCLGKVAHDLQALVHAEQLAHLMKQEVQADRLGVVIEDECRAELGVLVVLDLDDARVINAFEDLKFALGLAHQRLASISSGGSSHGVDANAAAHGIHRCVGAFPVLIRRTLGQQRTELVIAYLAVLV